MLKWKITSRNRRRGPWHSNIVSLWETLLYIAQLIARKCTLISFSISLQTQSQKNIFLALDYCLFYRAFIINKVSHYEKRAELQLRWEKES